MGYYWYGSAKHSFGRTPQWVQSLCVPAEPDQNYMNVYLETMENSDEDEQSQPESSDEVKGKDDDEIGTDDGVDTVSESHWLATTPPQMTEQQAPKDCPYALRKKIKPPARYQ